MGGFNFNPILSEIQGHFAAMSPEAQGAVKMAGMTPPAPDPTMTAPGKIQPGMLLPHPDDGPPAGPIGMGGQTSLLTMPSLPSSTPQLVTGPKRGQEMMSDGSQVHQGTILGDQAERGRLLDQGPAVDNIYHNITASGFGQAHPLLGKLLGGAAEVGGKIGDLLSNAAPGIGREIPGTTANHNMLLESGEYSSRPRHRQRAERGDNSEYERHGRQDGRGDSRRWRRKRRRRSGLSKHRPQRLRP